MTLSQNITFEEFEALANRKPNLKGSWVYMVTQPEFDKNLKHPYPMFELGYTKEIYFKTFQAAEKYIKKNTADVYCSWITQIPVGISSNYWGFGARWLYNQHGELIDYAITQGCFGKIEDQTFFGRPKSRQRFKVGDIVEVVGNKRVFLAVLNHPVPDVKRCWNIYNRCKNRDDFPYPLDYSDDCAVVIDGPNYFCHSHVEAIQLMKPRFPVPEDILSDMLTWNERCKNEEEDEDEWLKAQMPQREERQKEEGEHISEFYEFNIYLHFDENDLPHLHINDLYGLKIALRIDRPEYYDHDGYTCRLTNNQLCALQAHLSCPDIGKTKWWYILREWNENNENPKHAIPLDTILPNYLELMT